MPRKIAQKPYRVGRSRTGLGLFATQPIKKGTLIVPYVGRLLDVKKKKDDAVENKYLFELTNRFFIDGSPRSNIARYINHACRPNADPDVMKIKRKIVIRAIRNIREGEEINYNYGQTYFKEYIKPYGCKCTSCVAKRAKEKAERTPRSRKASNANAKSSKRKRA